ncbi:hypothetical protein TNCV_3584411 [Trichonephila clavipes]|nr:hypothetical protein TNCV_3584411 [Trichonephila clavipes]
MNLGFIQNTLKFTQIHFKVVLTKYQRTYLLTNPADVIISRYWEARRQWSRSQAWTLDNSNSAAQQPTRAKAYCAHPSIRDHWALRCMSRCPDQVVSLKTATAGSDVVQSGRPIFDDFFQHLWPYIGNNTANVVFQMVKRLWLIRIDQ